MRHMSSRAFVVPMLATASMFASACASSGSKTPDTAPATSSSAPTTAAPASQRRERDIIRVEELSAPAARALSVYDAIRQLRPNFLNVRGKQSNSDPESGKVHASIDYNGVISLDELKTMHTNGIVEIRYLDAGAAMQKFGGAAREGPVIVVKTI